MSYGVNIRMQNIVENSTKMSFEKMFHEMYELNLETQRTIQHVMCTLMGLPYNWTTPNECYNDECCYI
jgi:hypothetical protein